MVEFCPETLCESVNVNDCSRVHLAPFHAEGCVNLLFFFAHSLPFLVSCQHGFLWFSCLSSSFFLPSFSVSLSIFHVYLLSTILLSLSLSSPPLSVLCECSLQKGKPTHRASSPAERTEKRGVVLMNEERERERKEHLILCDRTLLRRHTLLFLPSPSFFPP